MYKYFSLSIVFVIMLVTVAQTKPKPATKASTAKKTETKGKPAPKSGNTSASFKISGKLEGYANYQIRLYQYQYNQSKFIDSVFTNDTGGFFFNKTLPQTSIIYVQYSSTTAVPLIAENGSDFKLVN